MDAELRQGIEALSSEVIARGREAGSTVGTAESCTGGLVAGALTAIPGSSAVVRGGIVSYDPAVKRDVLGVSQRVIDAPGMGVVSEQCALQMCEGARAVLGCDVAVSVTGIAGPGGAEPGKPVGTVWFGLAAGARSRALLRRFEGDREAVRLQAVAQALELILEGIEELANERW